MVGTDSAIKRYGYAVVAMVLAVAARIALESWFHYHRPYATFYIAALFTAWYGGLRAALVGIAIGGAALALLARGILPGSPGPLIGFDFYFIVTVTAAILLAQRRQAEDASRLSAERLRVTFEHAPVGFCRMRLDGSCLEANARFATITGYSSQELRNRTLLEVFEGFAEDAELRYFPRLRAGEISFYRVEGSFQRRDRTELWVELTVSLVRNRDGRPAYGICVLQDLTDRKRSEELFRRAQQMESVGLLAGGIAHDFNNLLTGVLGNASLAMSAVPSDSEAHAMLASIIASAERAAHLTKKLLAYAGKGGSWVGPVDLSETVREAVEFVRPSIPSAIKLRTDLEDGLPTFQADRSQIVQLITDLLLNSAEAIENRTGAILVNTSLRSYAEDQEIPTPTVGELHAGTYLMLRVEDTGTGIDGALIPAIFDPFTTTKFAGRGLGLAAVAGIVRRNLGAVLVSSTPGEGTALTVLFPVTGARTS